MWMGGGMVSSILVPLLFLFVFIHSIHAFSQPLRPESGCPFECPSEDQCHPLDSSCGNTVMDECGCCPVCVRQLGDSCGLQGVCDAPLQCKKVNETTSLCTKPPPADMEACLHANCPVVFNARCPSDSRLIIRDPPPGECCGSPGVCQCDREKCDLIECSGNKDRVLVKQASGAPGNCCDHFECRTKESHCANHACPALPLDEDEGNEECPEDSERPPVYRVQGQCCPVRPGCRCKASICKPVWCPEGSVAKVHRKGTGNPGSCCDVFECEKAGILTKSCNNGTRADGEEWLSGSCRTCKCIHGVTQCRDLTCPPPPKCTWSERPPGECCPVCYGCLTGEGEKKKVGETWNKDDCTTCSCTESGQQECVKETCKTDCDNPRKVDGTCCPVCDEPTILSLPSTCPSLEHCPLRCENGLRRDDRGCFECDCLPVTIPSGEECTALDKDNCEKQCAHGYQRDSSSGCPVCRCARCPILHQCYKHCLYGLDTNSAGCSVCKCRAMARIDARLSITDKYGKVKGGSKDKCVSLSASGKVLERDSGEWWSDGCRSCFCEQQQEFCSLISCPARPSYCSEENWKTEEGGCCPSCSSSTTSLSIKHEHTVCQSPGSGRLFTDGETWQLAPCISCTCRVGHVLCRVASCPPTPCKEPLVDPHNQCCPVCPKSDDEEKSDEAEVCTDDSGTARAADSSWRTDDCTSCSCNRGKIECFTHLCDDALKTCRGVPLVLKERCCPVCSDALSTDAVCTYENSVYAVNEEWKDGPCRNCTCVTGGQTLCRELMCPTCVEALPIPEGHCCAPCRDDRIVAFSEGNGSSLILHSYSHGGPSAMALVGLSLAGVAILALVFALMFFMYRRSGSTNKKSSHFPRPHSAVCLASTRPLGSRADLYGKEPQQRTVSECTQQSEEPLLMMTSSESEAGSECGVSSCDPSDISHPLTGISISRVDHPPSSPGMTIKRIV